MFRLLRLVEALIVDKVTGFAFAGARLAAPETDFAHGLVPSRAAF